MNIIYEQFRIFNGYCVLGCTLFYQGIFSLLHDAYGIHFCEIDYYNTLDVIFANLNFIYSSYLFFTINKMEGILFISSCLVLFGVSKCLSRKKNNMYVYVHILWHTVPVLVASMIIHNLLTLQHQPSSSVVPFSWPVYRVATH